MMVLACGILGLSEQASFVILINLMYLTYNVAVGLSIPACTLVGNAIGQGDIQTGKKYLFINLVITFFMMILESSIFYIY